MNINEPGYGILLDDGAFEYSASIETALFLNPMIEVELAFILMARLKDENVTVFDVFNTTDYIISVLEIIIAKNHREYPETGYTQKIFDTISDKADNANTIMGEWSVHRYALGWCTTLCLRCY